MLNKRIPIECLLRAVFIGTGGSDPMYTLHIYTATVAVDRLVRTAICSAGYDCAVKLTINNSY